jgi:hypothetical protein
MPANDEAGTMSLNAKSKSGANGSLSWKSDTMSTFVKDGDLISKDMVRRVEHRTPRCAESHTFTDARQLWRTN